jgi:hypothetical protein
MRRWLVALRRSLYKALDMECRPEWDAILGLKIGGNVGGAGKHRGIKSISADGSCFRREKYLLN